MLCISIFDELFSFSSIDALSEFKCFGVPYIRYSTFLLIVFNFHGSFPTITRQLVEHGDNNDYCQMKSFPRVVRSSVYINLEGLYTVFSAESLHAEICFNSRTANHSSALLHITVGTRLRTAWTLDCRKAISFQISAGLLSDAVIGTYSILVVEHGASTTESGVSTDLRQCTSRRGN